MPSLVRAALAVAAGLCLACAQRSPEEEILDQAETAISWIATQRMTGEQWSANSVPTSFVETTVEAAREELGKEADDAGRSKASAAVRDPFRQALASAREAGKSLRRAARANDRPAVAREIGRLASLQKTLETLREQRREKEP
jgi:hypothetical protein